MDPKRKRSETGPHSGLHSGKKIGRAAVAAVYDHMGAALMTVPVAAPLIFFYTMDPRKKKIKEYGILIYFNISNTFLY